MNEPTYEEKEKMFKNLNGHIQNVSEQMVLKQRHLLDQENLPVDTILGIHKKMLEMGQAVSWMMNVRATSFKEFAPRIAPVNGHAADKIIHP